WDAVGDGRRGVVEGEGGRCVSGVAAGEKALVGIGLGACGGWARASAGVWGGWAAGGVAGWGGGSAGTRGSCGGRGVGRRPAGWVSLSGRVWG
ncbi:hypothetical protein B1218_36295, partial [Pseudomonas ogarae]